MEKKLKIDGMSCQHCVHAVRGALSGIEGVKVVDVAIGEARVETDDSKMQSIREVLEEEGFPLISG